LLIVFVGGHHCLWCPKSGWSLVFDASVALKIGKSGLEARKLWSLDVGDRSFLQKKISNKQLIAYFQTSQKILKYYSVTFRVTR
jgi:hypothetical protein